MSPVCLEFHDGRINAVAMVAPGSVTITFSHLCAYFLTETADVFDVRSCQAEIVMRGATLLESQLAVEHKLEVSDGTITVDGAPVTPRGSERFTGACRISLELAGPFIGKLIVEGSGLEIRLHTIGRVLDQFHGVID